MNPKVEKKTLSELIKYLSIIIVSLIVVGVVLIQLPYYIEVPGSAENVRKFVTVDGKRDKDDGSFMLTTVGLRIATGASLLVAKFSPFQDIISKKELMGASSDKEYDRISEFQMLSSENMAKKVALDLAEIPNELVYKGVYVLNILKESSFFKELETGDIVTQVDDYVFTNSREFIDYVQGKKVGATVTIGFTRDDKKQTIKGKLIALPSSDKAGLGITLTDHSVLETDRDVAIRTEDIGGPSAGLMFTLELYNMLSGKDLRKGREIAGTGTIASDGSVGSIGGIDKKIVAAHNEGATVFFAPNEPISPEVKKAYPELQTNYEEAVAAGKKINTKMKIVPVLTVQDALAYLEEE